MREGESPKTNGPLITGMSFYLFLQLSSLGADCLPSLPARVNTPAPAGVWNLLSLCQLGTWRWVRLKACVMREGVGDRGCIYTEWGLQGSVRLWPLEVEKYEGKRKEFQCAQAPRPTQMAQGC